MEVSIVWLRRDLRLDDNAALYHALTAGRPVVPVFVFDKNILDKLEEKADRRVAFIYNTILELQAQMAKMGSSLHVLYDVPLQAFKILAQQYSIAAVYTNHDYEPYAVERDREVADYLTSKSIAFYTYKDQVIFEKDEVVKDDKSPYTVFTPYSRKWKATLNEFYLKSYPTKKYFRQFYQQKPRDLPTLAAMGFQSTADPFPTATGKTNIIKTYDKTRDYPANNEGTSRLGVHLRFGTLSIRQLARQAQLLNDTFLNELIWRDFYHMILWHFPKVGRGHAFRPEYENIQWRNNEAEFKKWCDGQTGYPIVDAGMRQLNQTGFMHNRVRMIVASFLTKHLLVDWRWGEAYFAEKLLDYDLAANNGGWQWAAGSGVDAAPYFRVFNPALQTQKFDPQLHYVRRWVPEFEDFSKYPPPMVDHKQARQRALDTYAQALKR